MEGSHWCSSRESVQDGEKLGRAYGTPLQSSALFRQLGREDRCGVQATKSLEVASRRGLIQTRGSYRTCPCRLPLTDFRSCVRLGFGVECKIVDWTPFCRSPLGPLLVDHGTWQRPRTYLLLFPVPRGPRRPPPHFFCSSLLQRGFRPR